MLKNRMLELSQVLTYIIKLSSRSTNIGSKLNTPPTLQNSKDQFQPIRQLIKLIEKKTLQVEQLRNQFKKQANPKKTKQINSRLDKLISQNKPNLQNLQKEITVINQRYIKVENPDGVKKAICQDLTIKAKKAVQQFRQAEEKFSQTARLAVKRQAVIMQGQITEEQVDNMMTNPELAQQLLKAKLFNSPSAELQSAVSDIMDKYRDIVKLEKNMQQCLQLTQQLALMVSLQGDTINTIQGTIGDAKQYVQNGEVALVKAKEHHKSAQKKIFCIFFLVLLLIGVVVIPIVVTQTGK